MNTVIVVDLVTPRDVLGQLIKELAVELLKDELAETSCLLTSVKTRMAVLNEEKPADPWDQASQSATEEDCIAEAAFLAGKMARLEKALRRAEEGEYGICEVCGRFIPAERMREVMEATTCVGCFAN
jgi:DnaK suppressor protein